MDAAPWVTPDRPASSSELIWHAHHSVRAPRVASTPTIPTPCAKYGDGRELGTSGVSGRCRRRGSSAKSDCAPPPSPPRHCPPTYGMTGCLDLRSGFNEKAVRSSLWRASFMPMPSSCVCRLSRASNLNSPGAFPASSPSSWRIRVEDQDALIVRPNDVARREVVAVARERQRLRTAHVVHARD